MVYFLERSDALFRNYCGTGMSAMGAIGGLILLRLLRQELGLFCFSRGKWNISSSILLVIWAEQRNVTGLLGMLGICVRSFAIVFAGKCCLRPGRASSPRSPLRDNIRFSPIRVFVLCFYSNFNLKSLLEKVKPKVKRKLSRVTYHDNELKS